MSRIAYFQPFSGVSGDMILGALVDVGLSLEDLSGGLRTLDLSGYRFQSETVRRGALRATRLASRKSIPGRSILFSCTSISAPRSLA